MQGLDQAGMETLKVESCVRGNRIYKRIWNPNSWRRVELHVRNYNPYAVAVRHNSAVVSLVPCSCLCSVLRCKVLHAVQLLQEEMNRHIYICTWSGKKSLLPKVLVQRYLHTCRL